MATIYVNSVDGSDADNGSTWALAKATLNGAFGIDAAGDNVYVSDNHAESTASAVTWTIQGTQGIPVKVIGADDAAEPPTARAGTAPTVTVTGGNGLTVNGCAMFDNLSFSLGSSSNPTSTLSAAAASYQTYINCAFNMPSSGSSVLQVTGSSSNTKTVWLNSTMKFGAAGQTMNGGRGEFLWLGGSIASGGTSPTSMINGPGTNGAMNVTLIGVNLANGGSSMNIFATSTATGARGVMRGCKLPASWSGSLTSATPTIGARFSMYNCDSTDTNYRLWIEDGYGSIKQETTLVKTSGASDGTTPISWKMVSNSNCNEFSGTLDTDEFAVWNSTIGSSITVTVDILRDSATNLKDNEVWLEVRYLGTSGYPLETMISDTRTDIFATAADQTSSSATWTTTGMSNPNKQKLSVSFTPQEVGSIYCKVRVAKASATIYVDPDPQVS